MLEETLEETLEYTSYDILVVEYEKLKKLVCEMQEYIYELEARASTFQFNQMYVELAVMLSIELVWIVCKFVMRSANNVQ